jgi:hypothetical protein
MLPDFPGTAPAPAAPSPTPEEGGADPLLLRLRGLWWAVPGLLLALDLFNTGWNLVARPFGYSEAPGIFRVALMWVPFAVGVMVVLGAAAFLWTRRAWPPAVRLGLAAGAAFPLIRFALGRLGPITGIWGPTLAFQIAAGPLLGLGLAVYAMTLRRGMDPAARCEAAAGTFAVALMAAVSGDWVAWGLTPLVALLMGDAFAAEAADPAASAGEPTPLALRIASMGGLACAMATVIVPVLGLMRGRGAYASFILMDAAALVAASLTWTLLAARWAKGRPEGKALRLLAWLLLALPAAMVLLLIALLLVFKPRLF